MGQGIAAHFANAGVQVLLFDIVPPDLSGEEKNDPRARDRFAAAGLKNALKHKPELFFHPSRANLIEVGNLEDDLERVKAVDLVMEVVVERLDVKRKLFERLEPLLPKDAICASNTSGLRIAEMTEGRSADFKQRFLVMHFFNPVRYMKLLELVAGPETTPEVMNRVQRFAEDALGKGVVFGKDTPNFVANRIGTHAMLATIHQMREAGLTPEDVDAITGKPMGHPKSASFRTGDLVGVDTLVHVANNCHESLVGDEDREVFRVPDWIQKMVDRKLLGNKTGQGFYKKQGKDIQTLDPDTLEYRPKGGTEEVLKTAKSIAKIEDPGKRVRKLVADDGKVGKFAWNVLSKNLAYAARRVGEIADSVSDIDDAMRWGYNWELGPFQVWDALGFAETVDRMQADGIDLPASVLEMKKKGASGFYGDDGAVYDLKRGDHVSRRPEPRTVTWEVMRKKEAPVLKNASAEAWDLGDGILGVTFTSKANSIDDNVVKMLFDACDRAESEFQGIVLVNQGEHFCVGANLFMVLVAAQQKKWDDIRTLTQQYQLATQRLKYATVPTVAAPFGMTLGGGLELAMGCDTVQAAAETYSGLVEVGVGLIPGGGGCMNMLWRAFEGIPEGANMNSYELVTQVFKNIAMAKVATSAEAGKHAGWFRQSDGVSFDRARQLYETKRRALGLATSGYHPPQPRTHVLPGESGIATLQMMVQTLVAGGYASEHDGKIAMQLARVLCGGTGGSGREVTEAEVLALEVEAFVSLCGEKKSQERMQHMLMNNKPLRN